MRIGTAIAAIWTPKRVILATDSKSAAGPVNKIEEAGNVFYTLAGLAQSDAPAFDANADIRNALEGSGSFKVRVAAAVEGIEPGLTQAVQFLHDKEPATFKEFFSGKNALDVIFCAKTGDEMSLTHVAFKTKRRGKNVVLDPKQRDFPNASTGIMSVQLIAAGVQDTVLDAFLKNTKDQDALVRPEATLEKFMDTAVAAEPAHIGYPVHLIKLGAGAPERTIIEK
jgi:hypothetical protein